MGHKKLGAQWSASGPPPWERGRERGAQNPGVPGEADASISAPQDLAGALKKEAVQKRETGGGEEEVAEELWNLVLASSVSLLFTRLPLSMLGSVRDGLRAGLGLEAEETVGRGILKFAGRG